MYYRPKLYFLALAVFLKFWHTLLILIFFLLILIKNLKFNNVSYLLISINLQNMIILLIFYFLNFILVIKSYFMFLIKLPYSHLFQYYNTD